MTDEVNIKEIELDTKALDAISEKVSETLGVSMAEKIAEKMAELQEATKAQLLEEINKAEKNIEKNLGDTSDLSTERKEMRLVKSAMALFKGDKESLKKYNEFAMNERTKAGYANTDINADGGYIVADPLFEAEIEKLAPNYGVSLNEVTVVPTSKKAVKTNKRGSNVTMYETGQGVAKTGTKLTIEQILQELRKFAAIAVSTDELIEDSAIDFWNEVTQGFAEETARWADVLVFTDTNLETPGILNHDGIIVESVGANISDITWDDFLNAESKVPTAARANMKHYVHRTVWNLVLQTKDLEGRYQYFPTMGMQTPWGTPVVLVDVLPDSSVVGSGNEGFMVTGDLSRVKLYRKQGLTLEQSNNATVSDADGNSVNLFEQDMTALRAVTRMLCLIKFPEALVVTGTGTVS